MIDIVNEIGMPAALEQCAEECVELSHACLKLARLLRNESPTPKTEFELLDNIEEEVADVSACLDVLSKANLIDILKISIRADKKLERWEKRILNNENKGDHTK